MRLVGAFWAAWAVAVVLVVVTVWAERRANGRVSRLLDEWCRMIDGKDGRDGH